MMSLPRERRREREREKPSSREALVCGAASEALKMAVTYI
jgi:hypothetical protein